MVQWEDMKLHLTTEKSNTTTQTVTGNSKRTWKICSPMGDIPFDSDKADCYEVVYNRNGKTSVIQLFHHKESAIAKIDAEYKRSLRRQRIFRSYDDIRLETNSRYRLFRSKGDYVEKIFMRKVKWNPKDVDRFSDTVTQVWHES